MLMMKRWLCALCAALLAVAAAAAPRACARADTLPRVGFETESVRVEGGQSAQIALVASAPFARDITLSVRDEAGDVRALTLPAGETRAAFTLSAPLSAKGQSKTYLLLKSEDFSRAKPYECRVSLRAGTVYRFKSAVFSAYAGEALKVRLTVANPERLSAGTRVALRDEAGETLYAFTHSQSKESLSFTLDALDAWRPGRRVSVWVDGRSAADDTALLAVGVKNVKSIYGVQRSDNLIAFTMDCGSGSDNVPYILDLLDTYDLKITFFVTGLFAKNNPGLIRDMAARGHEIGNHSWSHPSFYKLTEDEMLSQLTRAGERIEALSGSAPTLFRPPKGDCNARVRTVVNAAGYQVIRWTHECHDSRADASRQNSLRFATKDMRGGSIILSHVDADCTVLALPDILNFYRDNGFRVVKVSELLLAGETSVDDNGLQYALLP